MAISGTITLSSASTNMSTFDLYSCTSSSNSSCSGTAFETNVTRSQLLNGFVSNIIPDGTMYIKINPNIDGCLNQYIIVELSGVPVVSQTPTPTQTQTPTPTIPSGDSNSGCVTITQENRYEEINCLDDGPYNITITTVIATLDIAASVAVSVRVYGTRTLCYPAPTQSEQFDIVIPAGELSNDVDIYTYSYVDCGQESTCQVEQVSIDSYSALTTNYPICGPSVSLTPTPTLSPTPTPTEGTIAPGRCWTLVYDNLLPTDLYVRYRDNITNELNTVLINGLEVIPNGDGTYTTAICVAPIPASYSIPVFVQGGIEQAGGSYDWVMGGECTTAPICLLN